ncbi:hypothetical protein GCK72_022155 [Caenorhabditis remanei]|uniref:Uncharacterized protein n=2 Tax=Caenorhabditis remanei TaxID=31234 RepID=E3MAC4_CAERE|nr:hypothetical protein GCK72_022155 [Caenorhabditis remanei]EFO96831.1 hypothetical protein CRE_17246 [Caenorhabditis remanei]KAF1745708.1 hypothetical protein GCK72_022155 [Caenorhabditis remanei]
MGLTEYSTDRPPEPLFIFSINVRKEEIGTYIHPVVRRLKHFYFYHGKEFNYAIHRFYELESPEFTYIIDITRRFIPQRLHEIQHIRGKSRVVRMYQKAVDNFSLLFCRDLFAIMRYKEDYFKFERLENFLSFLYDPSINSLKDVNLKAFLQ